MAIMDIVLLVLVALGAWAGYKKRAINSFINLIGYLSIVIVSFQFKGYLSNIFIKYLPFINYGGKYTNLYSLNFIIYDTIAFVIVFIILYCLLNILLNLSGFKEMLNQKNLVMPIVSKIGGAFFGAFESLIFVFTLSFVMLSIPMTSKYVMNSTLTKTVVEKTPIVNVIFGSNIAAVETIYDDINVNKKIDVKDTNESNLVVLRTLMRYGITTSKVVMENIDNGKLQMENVLVFTK